MKTIGTAAMAALTALTVGCGGGGGDGGALGSDADSTYSSSGSATRTYPNGHPITLTTDDEATLLRESDVERLVNDRRIALGKNALIDSSAIRNVARAHSNHMIVHSFFAHTNPEGDTPGDRLHAGGVNWTMAGENIAAGYSTAQSAFDAWMASPGHKENIERDGWVYTGVGYWYDSRSTYGWYWTQNFTRP